MSKIAVVGAGKTGRGFIGRLLAEDGCEFLLIDKQEELVQKLNEKKSFQVHFFGNQREPQVVTNYQAVTWENADLSDVELIFVSVGGTNLPDVGKELKKWCSDGKKRYIITGENATKPAKTLLDAIGEANTAGAEATVFCTTIEDGELDIASENYPYLQCDAEPLKGYVPKVTGVKPVDHFGNFLTRKLFTYNAASCVIAYLGYVKGFTDYGDAANDPEILELLDRNYAATNAVLCKEYGYTKEDQEEFALLSKKKFCDRTITDTVARNAREPQRKMKAGERIMGPLVLLDKYGADTSVLIKTAAAMLLYRNEAEDAWQEIVDTHTPAQILAEIGGLPEGSRLSEAILKEYDEMRKEMGK